MEKNQEGEHTLQIYEQNLKIEEEWIITLLMKISAPI